MSQTTQFDMTPKQVERLLKQQLFAAIDNAEILILKGSDIGLKMNQLKTDVSRILKGGIIYPVKK